AIVEQRNVPGVVQTFEEFEQGAGAFGELEAEYPFLDEAGDPATHHVAYMEFGHLVVGHVGHREAVGLQHVDDFALFRIAARKLDAYEDMSAGARSVAIVEFGDGTPAEEADEVPVAAGPLGDGYGKQRFGAFADLGPFGHVAEAVEIDVGPRVDGDQRAFGSGAGFHFAA